MRGAMRSLASAVIVCACVAVAVPAQSAGGVSLAPWSDASLSTEFGQDGVVRVAGWNKVLGTVELPDGRLLLRVQDTVSGGAVGADGMVRLLADGSLDVSFGASGATPGSIEMPLGTGTTMYVRDSGKVLLGDGVVRQYTAGGELDASFGTGGTFNMVTGPAFELDDGSVMVTILNPVSSGGLGLMHLDENGVTVPGGLVFTSLPVRAPVALRSTSGTWRLVSAGQIGGDLSATYTRVIALNTTGSLDTTFGGGDGVAVLDVQAQAGAVPAVLGSPMPDGSLAVGVNAWGYYALARVSASGDIDRSFGDAGIDTRPWQMSGGLLASLAADDDGSLSLGITGRLDHAPLAYNSSILRTLPSGDVDRTFNSNGWTPGSVWLAELGVSGLSVGGSVTEVTGGAVLVSTTQYDPDFNAPQVAQLTRLQLPPHGRVSAIQGPAVALAPAVRLMNAQEP